MEKLTRLERMGGWIAAASFAVFAAMVADSALAAASIKDSKHNLGSTGTGSVHVTSGGGTDEVCVFCHTPHGGDTTRSAPLWNRGVGTGPYTLYDGNWGDRPSSLDGEVLPVGSISLLCLSCHDGATALDMMINAPGSGGYNASGASAGYTWTMGSGTMPAGRVANLTQDLRNDHPIGVPYCGGSTTAGGNPVTNPGYCKDKDFVTPATAGSLYWVDSTVAGGTAGVREKTDMILYVRTFAGTTGAWPSVECGSCHDPHNADTPTFLRIANTGSQVCLTCHVK